MARKIAFVFSKKDILKIDLEQFKIFALTNQSKIELLEEAINYYNLEDYFPKKQNLKLYRLSGQWAKQITGFNVDCFDCLTLSIHNFFAKKLFLTCCIEQIVKKERPEEVFLGSENVGQRWFRVNFDEISPIIKLACAKGGLKIVKGFSFDNWLFKFFLLFVFSVKFKGVEIKQNLGKSVIFASHHYHIENTLDLIKAVNVGKLKAIVVGKVGVLKTLLQENGISYYNLENEADWKDFFKIVFSHFHKKLFKEFIIGAIKYLFHLTNIITLFAE